MAQRYSGEVRVRIVYVDAEAGYDARVSWPGGRERVKVGTPAVLTRAVDSPEAYDAAARAAIAFAGDAGDYADRGGPDRGVHDGIVVSRRTPTHAAHKETTP